MVLAAVSEGQVWWLAYGLRAGMTGIKRHVVELAYALGPEFETRGWELVVVVDSDGRWCDALPTEAVVIRRPRSRGQILRQQEIGAGACLVHSFAPVLGPQPVPQVFTVFDWAPFKRSGMPMKGRCVWAPAVVTGIRRASGVHQLVSATLGGAPAWARWMVRNKEVATWLPDSMLSAGDASNSVVKPFGLPEDIEPGFVLFVGTNARHKRLRELVKAVYRVEGTRLVAVGEATEEIGIGERHAGLGRVSEAELQWCLRECAAVALVSTWEGLGLPVREAAAFGRPALVSRAVANIQPPELEGFLITVEGGGIRGISRAIRSVSEWEIPRAEIQVKSLGDKEGGNLADLYDRLLAAH